LKEGYALKRGTSGFLSKMAKHKRFFVLDERGFGYGEDQHAASSKRIDVYLAKIVQKGNTELEIVTDGKTYPLEFSSHEERDSWYRALTAAQATRAEAVEALVSRLERLAVASGAPPVKSKKAAKGAATPSEFVERLEGLTRRLEKVAR
jgi:hypothetical protein